MRNLLEKCNRGTDSEPIGWLKMHEVPQLKTNPR